MDGTAFFGSPCHTISRPDPPAFLAARSRANVRVTGSYPFGLRHLRPGPQQAVPEIGGRASEEAEDAERGRFSFYAKK